MIDGRVLDWVFGDGSWRLWNYDPNHHGDVLPGPAVATGQWASIKGNDHWLIPMADGKVLHWVEGNGVWELWNYDPNHRGDVLPGPAVAKGQWASIRRSHRLTPVNCGGSEKVLDYNQADGSYRLWNYDPKARDILPGPPFAQGTWGQLSQPGTLAPRDPWTLEKTRMPNGDLLDWYPGDGAFQLWTWGGSGGSPALVPVGDGSWATIRDGHRLIPMKDNRLLDFVAGDGSWRLWGYV